MQIAIKGSFQRDWSKLAHRGLSKTLREKIIEIESAKSISQISRFKKLRNYSSRYKIELIVGKKIYWALCVVRDNKIEFLRLKSETYFKKNL
ncbi:MAG TPA: hypothetical protein VK809_12400 [Bacteroidia bacterium]|jgi:hypothetical protein|nr:hypothetical protein [Bacteroidia bacterium]